jgi:hypothetical protein
MVMRDPAAASALFGPERDAVQARWLAAPPDPAGAFAEADELLARWTAAVAARPAAATRAPPGPGSTGIKEHQGGAAQPGSASREGAHTELRNI